MLSVTRMELLTTLLLIESFHFNWTKRTCALSLNELRIRSPYKAHLKRLKNLESHCWMKSKNTIYPTSSGMITLTRNFLCLKMERDTTSLKIYKTPSNKVLKPHLQSRSSRQFQTTCSGTLKDQLVPMKSCILTSTTLRVLFIMQISSISVPTKDGCANV